MLNTSLIDILRTIDRGDLKKYSDLIESPYFNKKSNVTKLFNQIKRFHPEFKSQKLNKENIWKELFPLKKFNYGIMKNLIYDLQKLSEKFLEMKHYENNKFMQKHNLLEELFLKNLDVLFEKKLRITEDSMLYGKIGETYFADMAKLEWTKFNYNVFKKRTRENIELFGSFNEYLMSDFMRQYFISNTNIIRFKSDFELPEMDLKLIMQMVDYVDNQKSEFRGVILMYYNAFMMMVEADDEKYFFELKKFAGLNSDKLDCHERFNIYTSLTNYCIEKSRTGNDEFEKEEFELYKIIVDNKAFTPYENGYINYITYFNIARLASKLKHFEWAYNFAKKYEKKLIPEQRKHGYLYTLAFIEFEKGNFNKSLEYISKLKYTEVREKPRLKILYMMIYFELNNPEQLFSMIDTSKHFVKNNSQMSEEYMKRFSNFVSIMNKISKIKFELPDEHEKEITLSELKKEVDNGDVPNKYWLVKKISDLSGKRETSDAICFKKL